MSAYAYRERKPQAASRISEGIRRNLSQHGLRLAACALGDGVPHQRLARRAALGGAPRLNMRQRHSQMERSCATVYSADRGAPALHGYRLAARQHRAARLTFAGCSRGSQARRSSRHKPRRTRKRVPAWRRRASGSSMGWACAELQAGRVRLAGGSLLRSARRCCQRSGGARRAAACRARETASGAANLRVCEHVCGPRRLISYQMEGDRCKARQYSKFACSRPPFSS